MHQQIKQLWSIAPVLSTDLIKSGQISKAMNSQLRDTAICIFETFVETRRSGTDSGRRRVSSRMGNDSNKINDHHREGGQETIPKRRRRRNISSSLKSQTIASSNSSTSSSSFYAENYSIDAKTGLTTNDYFFEYQRNNGYCAQIIQTPEMVHLQKVLNIQVGHYLSSIDNPMANHISTRLCADDAHDVTMKMDIWATIQIGEFSYHAEHVHENVFVSGVYYASVPEGSAPLVFHRPTEQEQQQQGNTSSSDIFHNNYQDEKIVVNPEEGQVVIFPPWLLHGVPVPSKTEMQNNDNPRVSYAFNVSGHTLGDPWDATRIINN